MKNLECRLNNYLIRITGEVHTLKENFEALERINKEIDIDNNQFVEQYEYLLYSLYNLLFDNLVLNISWMFSDSSNDKRSLVWCLKQIQNPNNKKLFRELAIKQINWQPSGFFTHQSIEIYKDLNKNSVLTNVEQEKQIQVIIDDWKNNIDKSIKKIEENGIVYNNLKTVRDKSIAHRDKIFFDNPKEFWDKTNLSIKDIEMLVHLAIDITKTLYGILKDSESILSESEYIGIRSLIDKLKTEKV